MSNLSAFGYDFTLEFGDTISALMNAANAAKEFARAIRSLADSYYQLAAALNVYRRAATGIPNLNQRNFNVNINNNPRAPTNRPDPTQQEWYGLSRAARALRAGSIIGGPLRLPIQFGATFGIGRNWNETTWMRIGRGSLLLELIGSIIGKISKFVTSWFGLIVKIWSTLLGFAGSLAKAGLYVGTTFIAGLTSVTAAAFGLAKTILSTGAEFERYKISLRSILGPSGGAEAYQQAIAMALGRPISVRESLQATGEMAAYGANPMMKITSGGKTRSLMEDVIAAKAGMPWRDMGQITRAIGQWIGYGLANSLRRILGQNRESLTMLGRQNGQSYDFSKMEDRASAVALFVRNRFGNILEESAGSWKQIMEDLGDSWDYFKMRIADSGLFQRVKEWLESWRNKIVQLRDAIKPLYTSIAAGLMVMFDYGSKLADSAVGGLLGLSGSQSDKIVRFAATLVASWEIIRQTAANLWMTFERVGKQILHIITGGKLTGDIFSNLTSILGATGQMVSYLANMIGDKLVSAINWLITNKDLVWDFFDALYQIIYRITTLFIPFIRLLNYMVPVLTTIVGIIAGSAVGGPWGAVVGAAAGAIGGVVYYETIGKDVRALLDTMDPLVSGVLPKSLDDIREKFKGLAPAAIEGSDWGKKMLESVNTTDAMRRAIYGLQDAFSKARGSIEDASQAQADFNNQLSLTGWLTSQAIGNIYGFQAGQIITQNALGVTNPDVKVIQLHLNTADEDRIVAMIDKASR